MNVTNSNLTSLLDYYNNLSIQIELYYIISVVPLGILTNLLAISIYSRKNLNKTNMGFYNICLGTSNIIALVFYILIQKSEILYNIDLYTKNDLACKVCFYSNYYLKHSEDHRFYA